MSLITRTRDTVPYYTRSFARALTGHVIRNPRQSLEMARKGYKMGKRVASRVSKYRKARGSKQSSTPAPTTFQNDNRVTYSHKRRSRKAVRYARSKKGSFNYQLGNYLGTKFMVNNNYGAVVVNQSQQGLLDTPLLNRAQVNLIFKESLLNPNTPVGEGAIGGGLDILNPSNYNPVEVLIKKCMLETEIRNSGANLLFIDLYYYIPRKDNDIDVINIMTQGLGVNVYTKGSIVPDAPALVTGGSYGFTGTGTTEMGLTPFQCVNFTENYLITKTRRVLLDVGKSFSFMQRMTKFRNISSRDWLGGKQNMRGLSAGVLVIASGTAGGVNGTLPGSIDYHQQLYISSSKLMSNSSQTDVYRGDNYQNIGSVQVP